MIKVNLLDARMLIKIMKYKELFLLKRISTLKRRKSQPTDCASQCKQRRTIYIFRHGLRFAILCSPLDVYFVCVHAIKYFTTRISLKYSALYHSEFILQNAEAFWKLSYIIALVYKDYSHQLLFIITVRSWYFVQNVL